MDDDPRRLREAGREYEQFVERQDVPVHTGYYLEDANACEVDYWHRTGVQGAIVNLVGQEGFNDIHIHEIPPGASMDPQRHLYEELAYVLGGQGATEIGTPGSGTTFEWGPGGVFALPRKTQYRHVNLDDEEPARLLCTTDLPLLYTLFKGDDETVFEPAGENTRPVEAGYYEDGAVFQDGKNVSWQSNFVPNSDLIEKAEEGLQTSRGTGTSVGIRPPDLSLWAHVSRIPPCKYRNIHRHHPGANVIVDRGEGYSLMWPSNDPDPEWVRVDWQPGTVFTPPTLWWHEHFNLTDSEARYFAHHSSEVLFAGETKVFDHLADYNIIDYPDEDPEIRRLFERELAERGLESKMPEELYDVGSEIYFEARRDD